MTIQISELSNGMRIVTENMPGYGSATVGVWTMVGSRHETLAQNGISHFLEHMAFKGTTRRTAKRIAEDIESVGGAINAYTGRERTAYYARVLKQDVGTAIDVIADILRDSILDSDDIETERGVILQEINQSEDTPDDIVFDWTQELSYPDQALGRAILGTRERVKSFERAAFQDYIKTHYTPKRMVLVAAGAVDHDAIVKQAENLFGDIDTIEHQKPEELARFNSGQLIRSKDLEQAHYVFSMPAPGRTDPKRFEAIIVSNILGGGMSSRLFQKAREELGLCYTIFTSVCFNSDSGHLTVYSGTGADQVKTLAELVCTEMVRLTDTLTEKELVSTKAQLRAGTIMSQESSSSRCERLAGDIIHFGKVRSLDNIIATIDQITVQKSKEMAAELFCNDKKVIVTYASPTANVPDIDELTARMA